MLFCVVSPSAYEPVPLEDVAPAEAGSKPALACSPGVADLRDAELRKYSKRYARVVLTGGPRLHSAPPPSRRSGSTRSPS